MGAEQGGHSPIGHQHRGLLVVRQSTVQQRAEGILDQRQVFGPAVGGTDDVTCHKIDCSRSHDLEDGAFIRILDMENVDLVAASERPGLASVEPIGVAAVAEVDPGKTRGLNETHVYCGIDDGELEHRHHDVMRVPVLGTVRAGDKASEFGSGYGSSRALNDMIERGRGAEGVLASYNPGLVLQAMSSAGVVDELAEAVLGENDHRVLERSQVGEAVEIELVGP